MDYVTYHPANQGYTASAEGAFFLPAAFRLALKTMLEMSAWGLCCVFTRLYCHIACCIVSIHRLKMCAVSHALLFVVSGKQCPMHAAHIADVCHCRFCRP
jgi:hypothetical protein